MIVILPLSLWAGDRWIRTATTVIASSLVYPLAHQFAAGSFIGYSTSYILTACASSGFMGSVALALTFLILRERWEIRSLLTVLSGTIMGLISGVFFIIPVVQPSFELRLGIVLISWQSVVAVSLGLGALGLNKPLDSHRDGTGRATADLNVRSSNQHVFSSASEEGSRSRCRHATELASLGGIVLLFAVLCMLLYEFHEPNSLSFDGESQPWTECDIPVPSTQQSVVFLRRVIHPHLAEYERRIRFSSGTACSLPTNIGGRTCINVSWYDANAEEGPYLRLQDHWGTYAVDLRNESIHVIRKQNGVAFIGEIPASSGGAVSSGWHKEDGDEQWTFRVGSNIGQKLEGLLTTAGQYLGRLDGRHGPLRFVSADESPEEFMEPRD